MAIDNETTIARSIPFTRTVSCPPFAVRAFRLTTPVYGRSSLALRLTNRGCLSGGRIASFSLERERSDDNDARALLLSNTAEERDDHSVNMPSTFHPRAQRNAFRRPGVHRQSRLFVPSQSKAATQPKLASRSHHLVPSPSMREKKKS